MKQLLGIFLGVLSTVLAQAVPKFNFENGKPSLVDMGDGRVAELKIDRKPLFTAALPFEVTENDCNTSANIKGSYQASLGFDSTTVMWVKHPDEKKVGQTISIKHKKSGNTFFPTTFNFYMSSNRKEWPIITKHVPNDQLSSADFGWLLSKDKEAPESASVYRWDVEMMVVNPETGLMENRTVGIASQLRFKKKNSDRLELNSVKRYLTAPIQMFSGDIWALMQRLPNGQFCHVSLKPNLVGLDKKFMEYFLAPPKWESYVWGTDEYSTVLRPFYLDIVNQNPEEYVFE